MEITVFSKLFLYQISIGFGRQQQHQQQTAEFLMKIMLFKSLLIRTQQHPKNQDDEHVPERRSSSSNDKRQENLLTIKLKRGLRRNQINKSFTIQPCYPSHQHSHTLRFKGVQL